MGGKVVGGDEGTWRAPRRLAEVPALDGALRRGLGASALLRLRRRSGMRQGTELRGRKVGRGGSNAAAYAVNPEKNPEEVATGQERTSELHPSPESLLLSSQVSPRSGLTTPSPQPDSGHTPEIANVGLGTRLTHSISKMAIPAAALPRFFLVGCAESPPSDATPCPPSSSPP